MSANHSTVLLLHGASSRPMDRRRFHIQGVDDYHQALETLGIDFDSDIESGTSSELDAEIDVADYVVSEFRSR